MKGEKPQPEKAVEAFRRAIALNPEDGYSYCSLAHALEMIGKKEEAINCHQKAISLASKSNKLSYSTIKKGTILPNENIVESLSSYR
jgi:Flp pilus assembly protein TadD